jgi:hypothetical protein
MQRNYLFIDGNYLQELIKQISKDWFEGQYEMDYPSSTFSIDCEICVVGMSTRGSLNVGSGMPLNRKR